MRNDFLNDDIKETMNVLSILGTNFHYNYRDKIMEENNKSSQYK